MIKLFRRRRYVVQAFHPEGYAPNTEKRFYEAYQADDYMSMVRRSYPWTEFVVRDRKTGAVSRYYHIPRAR
ncbi:hypothetical protein HYQ19_gp087 [Arthrobacter phage DrYang]|uniref:Uncharacterized protein n=1 Tax=Arthrobacter phage DrYang TaxID=2686080 RepID=A0A6B9JD64_9CAUD|nr:hypothetical protein HYQ19_gp087 [Arthrobacter phage DrYang]QGZ17186.1 hypothetical protein SEA_DRYANG_87 [Arthrobacter phage DrYang]